MASNFQHLAITSNKLDSVPIVNGRAISVTDTQESYFDYGGKRIKISDIITVPTYIALKKIMNPVKGKFYYVEDEDLSQLYYYNGTKFIKTSGYAHPVYTGVDGVWYGGVTVNQQGHVTEASNDPIPVKFGGTGTDNLDSLMISMGAASKKDIEDISANIDEINLMIDNHDLSIREINKNIEDLETSLIESTASLESQIDTVSSDLESHKTNYDGTVAKVENALSEIDKINQAISDTGDDLQTSTENLQKSIDDLKDLLNETKESINDQLSNITNSYFVRDLAISDWIRDNADDSYYMMLVRSEYSKTSMLVFPIVQIYSKIDDSYVTSYGYYDNRDYSVTIDSNQNITIKTKTAFPCRVVIHSLFDGTSGEGGTRLYKD